MSAIDGKPDLIIQLPYMVKSEERRKMIEDQLVGFKKASDCFRYYSFDPDNYGIAYIDATEHIIINKSIR